MVYVCVLKKGPNKKGMGDNSYMDSSWRRMQKSIPREYFKNMRGFNTVSNCDRDCMKRYSVVMNFSFRQIPTRIK